VQKNKSFNTLAARRFAKPRGGGAVFSRALANNFASFGYELLKLLTAKDAKKFRKVREELHYNE
jgi:hypothetical protein